MTASIPMSDRGYRREVGDGLVLRWSTAEDVERVCDLYGQVFRRKPDEPSNTLMATWTRDLMSGRHPLIAPADFAVVEDTREGLIVASTCLLSQVWTYGGIDVPVGRPEIVATREQYRNRGLIRSIFELIHARSASLGHLAQGITGIEYYYRQFGYEYALDLGGNRSMALGEIPRLKKDEAEPYRLREAALDDVPTIKDLYDRDRADALASARIDAAYWRWMLDGANPESGERWRIYVIADDEERACGYAVAGRRAWEGGLYVGAIGVAEGVSLAGVLPSALRALREVAANVPRRPESDPPAKLLFGMGRAHPVYEALGDLLPPARRLPYGWYVRVHDLPAFLRRVAPVLERRLRVSVVAGYSGELKLDFYRGGLRLVFADGRFESAEDWRRGPWDEAEGGFPPGVFLQILFGYHSLDELRNAFPDVWANDKTLPLLRALFPPCPSWVMPLD